MKKKTILPKVLYVGDKWCLGKKVHGISEWETNLWKSLKSTGLVNLEVFHFDDYFYQNKKPGDGAFIKKISTFHPDIICIVIYKKPGADFNVPKWKTLKVIKNHYKIPIIAIWGDLVTPGQVKIYKELLPYTTINAATLSAATVKRMGNPEKCIYMWVPKDTKIFNNPQKKRDINVSYTGSLKKDRLERINYLVDNSIPVYYRGGEREEHLTTSEYADIFKRSKITLSFARQYFPHYSHVIDARPFEAMNCGTMVMEEENFETPKLFIPFVDYVPYTSKKDLLEKVQYYLKHDKERKIIARNGYEKVINLYSARRFWELLIERVMYSSPYNTGDLLSLKLSYLSHMTPWRSFRLKFLDTIYSKNISFGLFVTIMTIIRKEDWEKHIRARTFPTYLYFQKRLSPGNFKRILKTLKFILHLNTAS